jgi:hypothetical protein
MEHPPALEPRHKPSLEEVRCPSETWRRGGEARRPDPEVSPAGGGDGLRGVSGTPGG